MSCLKFFYLALLSSMTSYHTLLFSSTDLTSSFNQNLIPVTYQLMDSTLFQQIVVGNTVVGITRQSQSLYMLYFAPEGYCELWKQDQIYKGNWWIEKDELDRDFVRAFWPQYASSEPKSLFSPENPHHGTATSVWYYVDSEQSNTIGVASKKFRASVLLVPGRSFPVVQ